MTKLSSPRLLMRSGTPIIGKTGSPDPGNKRPSGKGSGFSEIAPLITVQRVLPAVGAEDRARHATHVRCSTGFPLSGRKSNGHQTDAASFWIACQPAPESGNIVPGRYQAVRTGGESRRQKQPDNARQSRHLPVWHTSGIGRRDRVQPGGSCSRATALRQRTSASCLTRSRVPAL